MIRINVRCFICAFAIIAACTVTVQAYPQFFGFHKPDSLAVLEGNWQSCPTDKGYSERIYDHVVNGIGLYEVHLGPNNEFAIFQGVQDEHRAHNYKANLLQPYMVSITNYRAKQKWNIPSLGLTFEVTLAGGSDPNCRSWNIVLEPLLPSSR